MFGVTACARPFNAIIAFTGVDGVLLAVPQATNGESCKTLLPILRQLLQKIKEARLEGGCGLAGSCPTFHATDNYRAAAACCSRNYN